MNFEPLIEGISRFLGGHDPVHVERWLGELKTPEKQVPLIHDYLRGASALDEARSTGASRVRGITVPTWQSLQDDLEQQVQADPEVQTSLKSLFVNSKTPQDPAVTSTVIPDPKVSPDQKMVSAEVPESTPQMPQAKPTRRLTALTEQQVANRSAAWQELALGRALDDPTRADSAVERIRALHAPETAGQAGTPAWQHALNYMGNLEAEVGKWKMERLGNDAWMRSLDKFKQQSGIDALAVPAYIRRSLDHMNAWADAQKPGTPSDKLSRFISGFRTLQTSLDLSAPGRQGILFATRPEFWQSFRPMTEAWDRAKYLEYQAKIRSHPDFERAMRGGLAITDIDHKLGPREEAFYHNNWAEKVPGVKPSEQAYTTYLNNVRMQTFSNELRKAVALGRDANDPKLLNDLADMVNTFTGRGGGKEFNPGFTSTVLFAPRLAAARLQVLNPMWYMKLDPFVRQQALKTMLTAAASTLAVVSLAGAFGAKVTWDFRNPDAGKVRVGHTRIDLGGGMFQYIRLLTQLVKHEQVDPDTGDVKKLTGRQTLDKLTQFLISKESPLASFVTDWIRGADLSGHPFEVKREVMQHAAPLMFQDMVDVLKDKGFVQGLLFSIPAVFGAGLQTYQPNPETMTAFGVKGEVPVEQSEAFAKAMSDADKRALAQVEGRNVQSDVLRKKLLKAYTRAEREKVKMSWIRANIEAIRQAKANGQTSIKLVAPGGNQQ